MYRSVTRHLILGALHGARRLAAVTTACAVFGASAACARQPEPIGWNEEPAARPGNVNGDKPHPRPVRPPCRADDVESLWPDGGYTFSDGDPASDATGLAVLVRNVGPAPCSLSGYPKVQGTDADGEPLGEPAEPGIYLKAVDPGLSPAVIEPGEAAKVLLSTASAGCGDAARDVRGAEVSLDNGYAFTIKNAWLRGSCRLRVSAWGEIDTKTQRFRALEARLLSVPTVKAGTDLVYTLELINVTAAEVPLEPCPVFTQVLTVDDRVKPEEVNKLYHRTHRLNCSVKSVGPRGALNYQMRLPVPQDFPVGKTYVFWFAEEGGRHPQAMTAFTVTR